MLAVSYQTKLNHSLKRLELALHHLRFEGKASQNQNLKQMLIHALEIRKLLSIHSKIENQKVFPYLIKHVPKLSAVANFLKSEHKHCDEVLKSFVRILKSSILLKSKDLPILQVKQIQEKGDYLICLFSGHLGIEEKNIYGTLQELLKPDEKKEIERRLAALSGSAK